MECHDRYYDAVVEKQTKQVSGNAVDVGYDVMRVMLCFPQQ